MKPSSNGPLDLAGLRGHPAAVATNGSGGAFSGVGEPTILPHSEDAEKGVLCSLLLSPREVADLCVSRLPHNAFYIPAYRITYGLMLEFAHKNQPLDFVSLKQALKDRNQLEEIGGAAYLSALFSFVPTAANASYYINIVRSKYTARRLIIASSKISTQCYDHSENIEELLSTAQREILLITQEYESGQDIEQPFPLDCLPSPYGEMCHAVAESCTMPVILPVLSVLSVLSSGVSKQLRVRSGNDRETPGNLYIIGFIESGLGKSEAVRMTSQPLYELQRELIQDWDGSQRSKLESKKETIEARIKGIKKQLEKSDNESLEQELEDLYRKKSDIERTFHSPTLLTEDVTVERLATLLQENGETLSSISSDAGGVIQNVLGKLNNLKMTDEHLYLKAYSVESLRVDRQTRGPVFLTEPAINLLWFTQPDKISLLFQNESLVCGGFLARCMFANTNARPQEITGDEIEVPAQIRAQYNSAVREVFLNYRLSTTPKVVITPAREALDIMIDHYNQTVRLRTGDLKSISPFAARFTENAWRLSVCLHAAKYGQYAGARPLEPDTASEAIKIVDWFSSQLMKLMKIGRTSAALTMSAKLFEYVSSQKEGKITMRDLQRSGWDAEEVKRIVFKSSGKLAIETKEPGLQGGRRSVIVKIARNGDFSDRPLGQN